MLLLDKAKSFITGKGKGKGGALQKTGEQKPKVNPSKSSWVDKLVEIQEE